MSIRVCWISIIKWQLNIIKGSENVVNHEGEPQVITIINKLYIKKINNQLQSEMS